MDEAPRLTKMLIDGLADCANWSDRPGHGMHTAWRPATMRKLHSMGLVEKHPDLRCGFSVCEGWRLTEAGWKAYLAARASKEQDVSDRSIV